MPVALKLSRFYELIGQEAADEFVDALNSIDANYREEFRDLFAAHFGTVRAEMATVRAEMAALRATLDGRISTFEQETRGALKAMKSELVGWLVGLWFVSVALAIVTKAFGG